MKKFSVMCVALASFLACNKDHDDHLGVNKSSDFHIKDFVWKSMNTAYLWQEEVPYLADNRFESSLEKTNENSQKYVTFLNGFTNPSHLFENLKHRNDRFSFIVKDYRELEKLFQGVSLSWGMNVDFVRTQNNEIVAFVKYVIPGSNAQRAGVKRGDFITRISGKAFTETNLNELMNLSTSGNIEIAHFNQNQQLIIDKTVFIEKEEISENPILLHKIIEENGKKIGYLMYNGFVSEYNQQLNEVFQTFKQAHVTDFILDLRYNHGGSVETATYLASMLTHNPGKLFVKQKVNKKMKQLIDNTDFFLTDKMENGTSIASLNLSKIYIIASKETASASELIINGLKPYMQVEHIGEVTVGKNQASITMYDYIDANFTRNPHHFWAVQPIISRSENAAGFGDYENGLPPTYHMQEDPLQLGELGTLSDPLFAKAYQLIMGITTSAHKTPTSTLKVIAHLSDFYPNSKQMYLRFKQK